MLGLSEKKSPSHLLAHWRRDAQNKNREKSSVPEFIDPVFAKRSFQLQKTRKRAVFLGLFFAKTGSINSGTGHIHLFGVGNNCVWSVANTVPRVNPQVKVSLLNSKTWTAVVELRFFRGPYDDVLIVNRWWWGYSAQPHPPAPTLQQTQPPHLLSCLLFFFV